MTGKDCDKSLRRVRRTAGVGRFSPALVLICCAAAPGSSVRLWPAAVVTDEAIRLGDVARLDGFDVDTEAELRDLIIGPAPVSGGTSIVALDRVREVARRGGANPALVLFKGAAECVVSRPRTAAATAHRAAPDQVSAGPTTLRDAVRAYLENLLGRYGGRVQVEFGRAAENALDLAGPEYAFRVRHRGGMLLGLVNLDVEVRHDGVLVRQQPLVVNVTLSRRVVVARNAINQHATVEADDVRLADMVFTRVDRLGLTSLDAAIGQRAKRFLTAGTMLSGRDLEAVPLVRRGQIVDVFARMGGVQVHSVAKALAAGAYGDMVTLRSSERGKAVFRGVVSGPGRVEVCHPVTFTDEHAPHYAWGGAR